MLLQFNFKNFKSFRDDTTLDLTATKITELQDCVTTIGNEKVLPVAAIFGANAHGKSNVIEALRYMHVYVLDSFEYGGNNKNKKTKSEFYKPTPFLFDCNSKDAESLFEVYFIDSEEQGAKTYNYGFTVTSEGVNEEWLNYKSKTSRGDFKNIFYRNNTDNELDLSGLSKTFQDNIRSSLQKETLVVSLGKLLNIDILTHISDWFLDNEFTDFGDPLENFVLSKMIPSDFVDNKGIQDNVVKYFSSFDPSIIGFDVEVIKGENDDDDDKVRIDSIHKMANSDETAKLPLKRESSGTLKMFALYPVLQSVLECGGVLLIDELNSRLHPLLVRSIIITFLNPELNKKHAQLIFTSHDEWQLNGSGLRRDEIWFVEKDMNGISTLYSLVDFVDEDGAKIRKDENKAKNYLLGKYGAIPTLKCFDMFNNN